MSEPFYLAAKVLAAMALPDFCDRCFWFRQHAGNPPFSRFPGMFNVIDRLTKGVVHAYIDKHGHAQKWMDSFSSATNYLNVGRLTWKDEKNLITLRGEPDAVLTRDAELYLGDYKTASFAGGQDRFLPQYRIQLLAYSFLLEKNEYNKPKHAALIYFEPPSEPTRTELLSCTTKNGFAMPLKVEMVDFKLDDYKTIHAYLKRAREIYDKSTEPKGREGCRDCIAIDRYGRQRNSSENSGKDWVDRDIRQNGKHWIERTRIKNEPLTMDEDDGEWHPDWAE
jgi:hypothetical protein